MNSLIAPIISKETPCLTKALLLPLRDKGTALAERKGEFEKLTKYQDTIKREDEFRGVSVGQE